MILTASQQPRRMRAAFCRSSVVSDLISFHGAFLVMMSSVTEIKFMMLVFAFVKESESICSLIIGRIITK